VLIGAFEVRDEIEFAGDNSGTLASLGINTFFTGSSSRMVISNVQGLNARTVMRFVDLASQYQSKIRVKKEDMDVDGKSPMEMMILGAICGTKLTLCADGSDAIAALEALAKLIDDKFLED
jgi:phosphotransferase system HPr (HPr) family protein